MNTFTHQQALQAAALHANNNSISLQQVQQALGSASITFGQIVYATKVQVAAKHKAQNIQKVTSANVILCANVKAHTSVYANKVRRTAATIASNDPAAVAAFTPQATYFEHTSCHCIVQHKEHADKQYLYVIYNNAQSHYIQNGKVVTLDEVMQYLTPSAVRNLTQSDGTLFNVTHGITHKVAVRTIALSNIVSIKARKQVLSV